MNTNCDFNEFINDYNNLSDETTMIRKYNMSRTTYYNLIRKLNLKRDRATKLNKIMHNLTTNNTISNNEESDKPQDVTNNDIDEILNRGNNILSKSLLRKNIT